MEIKQITTPEANQTCLVLCHDEYLFGTWRPNRFNSNKLTLETEEHWRYVEQDDKRLQEIWLITGFKEPPVFSCDHCNVMVKGTFNCPDCRQSVGSKCKKWSCKCCDEDKKFRYCCKEKQCPNCGEDVITETYYETDIREWIE